VGHAGTLAPGRVMATQFRLGKRTLDVSLSEDAEGLQATVDGRAHHVRRIADGAARDGDGGAASEMLLAVDGRVWRAFAVRAGDRVLVSVDGRAHAFDLGEAPRRGAAAVGRGLTVAPMPGKVLQVLVVPGDAVEPGQPLVVLEAMKMETTLRAEIAGTVTVVRASPGAMTEAGAPLVEVRPFAGGPA
jgi:3-methylcrotonyl-CoA carboxylase alpha subunit